MENYMYFLNLDDKTVKFGISSSIHSRICTHTRKFITKLGLKDELNIINMIQFDNKILNVELESRFKKYLKRNNKNFKMYSETEVFNLSDYDFYLRKILQMTKSVIEEYNIIDNSYEEMSREDINNIYTLAKTRSSNFTKKLCNSSSKNICVRCGTKVVDENILYEHFNEEILCDAKYVDVCFDKLIENYKFYYCNYTKMLREYDTRDVLESFDNINTALNTRQKNIKKLLIDRAEYLSMDIDDILKDNELTNILINDIPYRQHITLCRAFLGDNFINDKNTFFEPREFKKLEWENIYNKITIMKYIEKYLRIEAFNICDLTPNILETTKINNFDDNILNKIKELFRFKNINIKTDYDVYKYLVRIYCSLFGNNITKNVGRKKVYGKKCYTNEINTNCLLMNYRLLEHRITDKTIINKNIHKLLGINE